MASGVSAAFDVKFTTERPPSSVADAVGTHRFEYDGISLTRLIQLEIDVKSRPVAVNATVPVSAPGAGASGSSHCPGP